MALLGMKTRPFVECHTETGLCRGFLLHYLSVEQATIHFYGKDIARLIKGVGLLIGCRLLTVYGGDAYQQFNRLPATPTESRQRGGQCHGCCLHLLCGLAVINATDGQQHQSVPVFKCQVAIGGFRQFHCGIDTRQKVHVLKLPPQTDEHRQVAAQILHRLMFRVRLNTGDEFLDSGGRDVRHILLVCSYQCYFHSDDLLCCS